MLRQSVRKGRDPLSGTVVGQRGFDVIIGEYILSKRKLIIIIIIIIIIIDNIHIAVFSNIVKLTALYTD